MDVNKNTDELDVATDWTFSAFQEVMCFIWDAKSRRHVLRYGPFLSHRISTEIPAQQNGQGHYGRPHPRNVSVPPS